MIKVDKIASLDGDEIKVNDLVTFENGVLKNSKDALTFDINSGLNLERIKCDTLMKLVAPDLEKDKEYVLNQEVDENPFIRLIPTVLFQPSDEIIDPSKIRLSIKYDNEFVELIPTAIEFDANGSKAIYDTIEVNTNSVITKILSDTNIIANIQLEVFSY